METMCKEAIVAHLKVLSQRSHVRTKTKRPKKKKKMAPAGCPCGHILNISQKNSCLNLITQNHENVCLHFIHYDKTLADKNCRYIPTHHCTYVAGYTPTHCTQRTVPRRILNALQQTNIWFGLERELTVNPKTVLKTNRH